jgi:hypothetical protein
VRLDNAAHQIIVNGVPDFARWAYHLTLVGWGLPSGHCSPLSLPDTVRQIDESGAMVAVAK